MKKVKNLDYYTSLHYLIDVVPFDTEDGVMYEVYIPQLGRYAFNGVGETVEQAIDSLNGIKAELFSQMLEEGREIPEPNDPDEEFSGRVLLRMDKELHRELVFSAREKDISLNKHINDILNMWKQAGSLEAVVSDQVKVSFENAIEAFANGQKKAGWQLGSIDMIGPNEAVPEVESIDLPTVLAA